MTPEEILSYQAKVLSEEQRRSYFENGYLLAESIVSEEWVERLLAVTGEMGHCALMQGRTLLAEERDALPVGDIGTSTRGCLCVCRC